MAWQRKSETAGEKIPAYLRPYLRAADRHGGGFASLLWASRKTQVLRFDTIVQMIDLRNKTLIDVGAGRGDLLDYLIEHDHRPAHYYAIEAVTELADEIQRRDYADCTVIRADFVDQPQRMFVGAEVVLFSGSLNTLTPVECFATLRRAYEATSQALVFNFLSAPTLAAANHLYWHSPATMKQFASSLSDQVQMTEDYLDGDCTVVMGKS